MPSRCISNIQLSNVHIILLYKLSHDKIMSDTIIFHSLQKYLLVYLFIYFLIIYKLFSAFYGILGIVLYTREAL